MLLIRLRLFVLMKLLVSCWFLLLLRCRLGFPLLLSGLARQVRRVPRVLPVRQVV